MQGGFRRQTSSSFKFEKETVAPEGGVHGIGEQESAVRAHRHAADDVRVALRQKKKKKEKKSDNSHFFCPKTLPLNPLFGH